MARAESSATLKPLHFASWWNGRRFDRRAALSSSFCCRGHPDGRRAFAVLVSPWRRFWVLADAPEGPAWYSRCIPGHISRAGPCCFEAAVVSRIKFALFAFPLLVLGTMAATRGNTAIGREMLVSFTQANPIGSRPQIEVPEIISEGRTSYDPNTITKIRVRFDAIIKKVHVSVCQKVKKGDALVELFGDGLAAAKNDYRTSYVQWQRALKLLRVREKLFAQEAIAEQVLVDSKNDEGKSRLALSVHPEQRLPSFPGVPEDQVDSLIKDVGNLSKNQQVNNASEKGKLALLSPIDGVVVRRDVVPGNLYDPKDVLMVVAPIDHFLVWTNLWSMDMARVEIGQACEVLVPFLDQAIVTKFDYISREVRDQTDAIVRIKLIVPNVEGRLKADMLVRVRLRPVSTNGKSPAKN